MVKVAKAQGPVAAAVVMALAYGAGHLVGVSTHPRPDEVATLTDGIRHTELGALHTTALVTVVEACGPSDATLAASELLADLREPSHGVVHVRSMLAPKGVEPGLYVNGLRLLPPWTDARLAALVADEKARAEAAWLRGGDRALLADRQGTPGAIAYVASCPVD